MNVEYCRRSHVLGAACAALALCVFLPGFASAQGTGGPISVHASAGTNVNVGGNTQSVAVGVATGPRVSFLLGAERLHMPTEVTEFEDGSSVTRGGTATFVSGEIRVLPLTRDRVSPYLLAGLGVGVSRPNVNEMFPDEITNRAVFSFFGGGVHAPVTSRLSVFGDLRLVLMSERADAGGGVFLFVPVRAGVTWRF